MPLTKLKNGQLPNTISSKTVDNTNDINTTTTRLKISGGSNGQVLSTDGSSNISWITAGSLGAPTALVSKTADESITGVTLQDDDHLFYNLTTGRNYHIRAVLFFSKTTTNVEGSIRYGFTGNSDGYAMTTNTVNFNKEVLCDGSTSTQFATDDAKVVNKRRPIVVDISLSTTASFTFKLRWAQAVNSAINITKLYKHSYIQIYDLGAV